MTKRAHRSDAERIREILEIRELQTGEAKQVLGSATAREAACRERFDAAVEESEAVRRAWQGYFGSAHPAPALLQDFRTELIRISETRAGIAKQLDDARAERERCERAVQAAILREDLARRISRKLYARLAQQNEERRLQTAEERTSYQWSQR
ncbi:hypothetical protein [Hyphomonas sp.]|uniref:hypothetical protein n=1 Tax=Hyphomonas sp. TaxID=87 RepID=UPI0025C4078A|nr:hypothetical protein [Hyphomonas sp.]